MALSHNELWLHSAAKKYDKTETFLSSIVRAAAAAATAAAAEAAAAAGAAAEAVQTTAEAVGDYYRGHITHTIGIHCIHIISRNKI